MAPTLRSIALAGLAVVAPLAVASCGGDDGGNGGTDPETTGTISVTVQVDGSGQAGVAVNLYAAGANTATATSDTNGSGVATFSDVEEGSWEVEVVVTGTLELDQGEDARKSATVTAGQTASVSFDLIDTFQGEQVSAVNLSFNPANVTIETGESVRWTNNDSEAHNVTPDGWSGGGNLSSNGSTLTETFNSAGTYDYECTLHAGMTGRVTVVDP